MRPLSAKNAKVRIGGNILVAAEWDVEPEGEWPDTTSFEDGGHETQVFATDKCEVKISGYLDRDANPFDNPLNLQVGLEVAAKLYVNDTTGPFWNFPKLSIKTAPMSAKVKDKIMISFSGKANGLFIYPTGNA